MKATSIRRPRVPLEAQALMRARHRVKVEIKRLELISASYRKDGDPIAVHRMGQLHCEITGLKYAEAVMRGELRAILGKEGV
ncbi:hypothetical protein [Verrucomicrobium spinosum]|uniref:hypothetical protein n=1 Tax=Verrucomicrobium spinosum TaxID=2736 RepID=UPI0002D53D8C|nr:hypothetical protein [Verrucomicrobium spinosum]